MAEEQTTRKVHIDLELDTSVINNGDNPWSRWVHLARTVDAWRIFPRIFLVVYIVLLYQTTHWFMDLTDPNNAQAGLISVVVGAGAAWFGLYVGAKKKDDGNKKE